MNIYVGNLPYSVGEEEVRDLFAGYGEVESVKLIKDRETGRKKGFGFVTMEQDGGMKAIEELNGTEFGSRELKVNEARERAPRNNNFAR